MNNWSPLSNSLIWCWQVYINTHINPCPCAGRKRRPCFMFDGSWKNFLSTWRAWLLPHTLASWISPVLCLRMRIVTEHNRICTHFSEPCAFSTAFTHTFLLPKINLTKQEFYLKKTLLDLDEWNSPNTGHYIIALPVHDHIQLPFRGQSKWVYQCQSRLFFQTQSIHALLWW